MMKQVCSLLADFTASEPHADDLQLLLKILNNSATSRVSLEKGLLIVETMVEIWENCFEEDRERS